MYTVNLHDLRPGTPVNMTVIPDTQPNRKSKDRIISVVSWLNNNTVFSISMNRVQNKADLQRCEISQLGKPSCHTVYENYRNSINTINIIQIYIYL